MINKDIISELKVGSMNCNGLGNTVKRKKVLNWLNNKEEEIFMLQETHTVSSLEKDWERIWGSRIYFNHGRSNALGTTILIKKHSNIKVIKHQILVEGRLHYLEIDYDGNNYCLVNVYSPNKDDVEFLKTVFHDTLGRFRDDQIIYGGTGMQF